MPFYLAFILLLTLIPASYVSADQQVLSIVSHNLNRFFDDKSDGNQEKILSNSIYRKRLHQLVNKIVNEYKFANVIAFQEVENKSILLDVSKIIRTKYGKKYHAILIEGNDISGIDVGFLVDEKLMIKSVKTLFSNKYIPATGNRLFSRPPLIIELCLSNCYTVINLHLRSMRGLSSSKKRKRVILKRRLQAEMLARWIDTFQHQYPQQKLIVVGDFNALNPSDHYIDSLGTILGNPDQHRPKWKTPDLIKRDLVDTTLRVSTKNRYSYKYRKKKQLLDYLLVSKNLSDNIKSISFSDIDYRFSDHAALKAEILAD